MSSMAICMNIRVFFVFCCCCCVFFFFSLLFLEKKRQRQTVDSSSVKRKRTITLNVAVGILRLFSCRIFILMIFILFALHPSPKNMYIENVKYNWIDVCMCSTSTQRRRRHSNHLYVWSNRWCAVAQKNLGLYRKPFMPCYLKSGVCMRLVMKNWNVNILFTAQLMKKERERERKNCRYAPVVDPQIFVRGFWRTVFFGPIF